MGIVRTEEIKRTEIEEFQRMLLSCASVHRRKDEEGLKRGPRAGPGLVEDDEQDKVVCVTSGVSYLGRAIVNRLLLRGYSVRITVDNQEDLEKLREMETTGEMGTGRGRSNFWAVVAKLSDVGRLSDAFEGCRGVFHTCSFADPAGLSGYSKSMAEIEVKATENVMEACARTPSVRSCVLTSSLLACVWRPDDPDNELSCVINPESWSNESVCLDKKLWYALGKLRAEKAAWRIAEERGLKLTTICSALITGPQVCGRNPTPTIAYLKGAPEMYMNGLLATVDALRLADAHVSVYEAMNHQMASGRYICFDRVIDRPDKAAGLASEMGFPMDKICGSSTSGELTPRPRFELSNRKLSALMSRTPRCCFEESNVISDVHRFCR
ncbi:hypothetical protein CDL15_Pgr005723 [Punica granatum]|uniref:3-beta hydroxysteroid dehydrogenase/isomerase domain-containing protein n=1 Tax=Punica granatum TaxID=22663 RepID=A0A218WFU5_PUNGR|nr:hypothetical protein CDL15_Pgr005723 [Punica granatum]PKI79200.1 hypothetical protein CRG98_000492 [Punica granatum]